MASREEARCTSPSIQLTTDDDDDDDDVVPKKARRNEARCASPSVQSTTDNDDDGDDAMSSDVELVTKEEEEEEERSIDDYIKENNDDDSLSSDLSSSYSPVTQSMVRREEARCASQSVRSTADATDDDDDNDDDDHSLYGIGKGMPKYMREAFHTSLLMPHEERFGAKSIVANFYDYSVYRTTYGLRCGRSGYNNFDIMIASDLFKQNGYLCFWWAYKIIDKYNDPDKPDAFTSGSILSVLSTVPDSSILITNDYRRVYLLRLVLSKYHQECKTYLPELTVYINEKLPALDLLDDDPYWNRPYWNFKPLTNFTARRVGRLWLMTYVESFYGFLLNDIVSLPHETLLESDNSGGDDGGGCSDRPEDVPRYLRRHTTQSMLLILLARISNDLFKPLFYEEVIERDTLDAMFRLAMSNGYTTIALVFSLFVDRARVRECCLTMLNRRGCRRDVDCNNANARAALFYMLQLRDLPFQPSLPNWDRVIIKRYLLAPIFDHGLSTKALECILRHGGGISATLRLQKRVNLSPSITHAISRYFYTVVWNFITVHEEGIRSVNGRIKVH